MSDRERKANNAAGSFSKRHQPRWFVLSVLLHVTAALALIFLTPIRDVLLEEFAAAQASSQPQMSTQQLREVNDQLDEITEDHIERNVQAMHELLEQMQYVNDEAFQEFVVFEHAQIERTLYW